MECVSDYVQFDHQRAEAANVSSLRGSIQSVGTMRPGDASLQAKMLFCQARAHIAASEFPQAIEGLNRSLASSRSSRVPTTRLASH